MQRYTHVQSTYYEHDYMEDPVFGTAMPLEDIKLDDVLRHPIWVWALDEEGVEGQDETWQKPVTNTTDLSRSLEREYIAVIAVKVVGAEMFGCGDYDHDTGRLSGMSVWHDGDWQMMRNVDELEAPLEFEAIPSIFGEVGVRFVCHDLTAEEAVRADGKRSRSLFAFIRRLMS